MRPLAALALVALLAGCGGDEASTPTPAGDPSASPPPFELESRAGRQSATQGSSCVTSADEGGMFGGICADTVRPLPEQASVVRAGETITISMPGAALAGASAQVHPLGCRTRTVARFALRARVTTWRASLPEGTYELALFARFTATDGRSGDSSAAAGIRVSDSDDLELVELGESDEGACP